MVKVSLKNLNSLQNETSALADLNSNSTAISAGFDNSLSRDGLHPNHMNATLDMNSHRIINLPSPLDAYEPLRLVDYTRLADPTLAAAIAAAAAGFPRIKIIEDFGGGLNVADNTPALLAALATTSGPVRILFSQVGDYKFTQANAITITRGGVTLEGASRGTALRYEPTSDGIFLQWLAPVAFSPIIGGGLKNISIYAPDVTTYTKTAVSESAVSMFEMENVSIGADPNSIYQTWTGGTGSCCFYPHGWDFGRINKCWFSGDMPVRIGMNPYWSHAQDLWHWSDIYLQGTSNIGIFSLISVDIGVAFSNTTFDGYQSWVNGANGFYWDNTGAINSVYAIAAGGSGYAVGDSITLAGGTVVAAPVALVLSVDLSGAITGASVKFPGSGMTALPAGNVWTQSSTTGSGTGAQLNAYYVSSYNLKFSNVRCEQGDASVGSSCWNFYIREGGIDGQSKIINVALDNCFLDGNRNGIYLQNTSAVSVEDCVHTGNIAYAVTTLNATTANHNDSVRLQGNTWTLNSAFPLGGVTTGLNPLQYTPNPSSTNAATLQDAVYDRLNSYTIPILNKLTTKLTTDIPISNATYTDILTVTQGAEGTWLISGQITVTDTAASSLVKLRLWDGTNLIATPTVTVPAAGVNVIIPLAGIIASPTSTIIRAQLLSSTATSKAVWSASGDGTDSKMSVVRIG